MRGIRKPGLILIAVFSLAVLFYEGLFFGREYYHIHSDGDYFLNFAANLSNASYLKQGVLPLWNPLSCGGFSAIGADHYETNPINPMLVFPYLFGMNSNTYYLIFFFILAFLAAYCYFKYSFSFSAEIDFTGAMIYANAIFLPTNMNDGLLFALFPLNLYLIERFFSGYRLKPLVSLSLVMAVVFLGSFCHRFADMLLLTSLYFFLRLLILRKEVKRSILGYGLFLALLIGLISVTLIPQGFSALYETRRNRPLAGLEEAGFMAAAGDFVSYIFTNFFFPFKSEYIDFNDFSLKISKFMPLKSGPYLSILFIPGAIYFLSDKRKDLIGLLKGWRSNQALIFSAMLLVFILIPAGFLAGKLSLHEQLYYTFAYLQRYTGSVFKLFLILPVLCFLMDKRGDGFRYSLPFRVALSLFMYALWAAFIPFLALAAAYNIGQGAFINFALEAYNKHKFLPYELDSAFLKLLLDYFFRSPLCLFIIALFSTKILLIKKLFNYRRLSRLLVFLVIMDCILAQKVYNIPHDDYRRLWVYETPEKSLLNSLSFKDRVIIKRIPDKLVGEGWFHPEDMNYLKENDPSFFRNDLNGIRKRAWFPDYRYRNPGYLIYGHSVYLVSAFQGLSHLLPRYLKEYMLRVNSAVDPGKVDFIDWVVFDVSSRLVDIAGVNYIFSSLPVEKKGLEFLFKGRQYYVYRNTGSFGKAYFAWRYEVMGEKAPAGKALDYLEAMGDNQALINADENVPSPRATSRPEYSIDFLNYSPNRVTMAVQTDSPGVLVLNDTFYPGWRAEVDAREEKIFRANMMFRGIFLGPGFHQVEFSYHPIGYLPGLVISLSTLAFILVFFTLPVFRRDERENHRGHRGFRMR